MTVLPPSETPLESSDDALGEGVLVFNANDASGCGGLGADLLSIASVGGTGFGVVTGAYVRDTSEVFDHHAFDDEAVTDQARAVLEDSPIHVFKVGFVGSAENLGAVAAIASDYAELPLIAYMPDLSWWREDLIDQYLDAHKELLLPLTTVLVGSHSALTRWLLPDWSADYSPSARDIARAAAECGVPYTLVTGVMLPDQCIDNVLCTASSVLYSSMVNRFDATFAGAGDTLSAALAGLLADGTDLPEAAAEALSYLEHCLLGGHRTGMGHVVPDRLFWAHTEFDDESDDSPFDLIPNDTRH